jgi:hypothetical protein
MTCALAALVLIGTSVLRAQGRDDAAKEKKVRELLRLSGELTTAKDACDAALKKQKGNASLPPGYIKRFGELADEKFFEDVFTPVYMKHFDEEDIDAIIAFYKTPAGKKLIAERPSLMKDAAQEGMTAGAKLGVRVMEELRKEQDNDDDDAPKPKKPEKKAPKDEDD